MAVGSGVSVNSLVREGVSEGAATITSFGLKIFVEHPAVEKSSSITMKTKRDDDNIFFIKNGLHNR